MNGPARHSVDNEHPAKYSEGGMSGRDMSDGWPGARSMFSQNALGFLAAHACGQDELHKPSNEATAAAAIALEGAGMFHHGVCVCVREAVCKRRERERERERERFEPPASAPRVN